MNGLFSHQEAKKCVGVLVRLRTLALGIDVKWGCLLLESEVWGQIRFLFVLGSKGTGNGGWSMKTKFYVLKSMNVLYNTNLIWEHVMFMNPKFSACNKKI